jgi:threonine/homoserine/homoserine lactone efflux protein
VQPCQHEQLVAGRDAVERGRQVRREDEPGLGRALVALLGRGRAVGQRRLDAPDRDELHVAHGRHGRVRAVTAEFLLTSLVIVATPGDRRALHPRRGLSRGARASVLAALACTLGIVPHMLAAITGLAALLHTSALAFQVLKYLGVLYLLFMAYSTLKERGALTVEEGTAPRSARKVIVSGVLINILNPKLTIFFFAFLPSSSPPARAAAWRGWSSSARSSWP